MTPAGDALVGTLMQKDRFSPKLADEYKFVSRNPETGNFETSRLLEACQMLFTFPGPIVMSSIIAVATHHHDLVTNFFHIA